MTAKLNNLYLPAAVTIEAKTSPKTAKVSILAYGGGIMKVPSFGDLAIVLDGLDLSQPVVLLSDHENSLSGIVGQGTASIINNQLFVKGEIPLVTEAAQKIVELAKGGFQFQASVGVLTQKTHFLAAGEIELINGQELAAPPEGLTIIDTGILRETSIVALGCDSNTAVKIAAQLKGNTMPQAAEKNTSDNENVLASERKRVLEINDACSGLVGVDQTAIDSIRAQAINSGTPAREVSGELLRLLRASRAKAPAIRSGPAIHDGSALHANSSAILEASFLTRAGMGELAEKQLGARVMEESRQFQSASFVDLCRASLQMEGRLIPSASRNEMIRAGVSTYALPTALGNAMNKSLAQAYNDSPATWRSFCSIRSANDFKNHASLRPSFTRPIEEVAPDGQLKDGSLKEAVFNWSVDTYGRMLKIPRTDIVNDNLGFLDEVAPMMAKAALRKLADLVYSTLLTAPSSYFDATLGNLGTDPMSMANLGTAIASMRNQTDAEDNNLDIGPETLLVGPDQETAAKVALESEFTERIVDASAAPLDAVRGTGNAVRKAVKLEVE